MKFGFLISLLVSLLSLAIGLLLWSQGGRPLPLERDQQVNKETIQAPADYPVDFWERLDAFDAIRVTRAAEGEEFPKTLSWEAGCNEPEIGDPAAKIGGRLRLVNAGPYPLHVRPFGGMGYVFFNYTLYSRVDIPLVVQHPQTRKPIPGVARRWAVQGRDVYLELHPDARYSNGRPVRARDYLLSLLLRTSPYAQNPLHRAALQARIESITYYDDQRLHIRLRRAQPLAVLASTELLFADEPGFYCEFGPDYAERYAQRVAPTTGGYMVLAPDRQRGRLIIQSRVKNWWARDKRYYRYRCNVDRVEHHFLSDEAQVWEFFLAGKLDLVQSRNVATWQQRLECPDVWEGRIETHRFMADYPLPPYGIYLNSKTIPDLELRRGIMAALDMDHAIQNIFRGEAERLRCFSEGYGELSPRDIPEFHYDPEQARAAFHAAGYTQQGQDGILIRPDGKRLSFQLAFTPSEKISSLIGQLAASARRCGLEIVPLPKPWQQTAELVEEKRYELAFWADVATNPIPQLAKLFHSRYRDQKGLNLHYLNDATLDTAIEEMDRVEDMESLRVATREANLRLQELAIWLPGWKENSCLIANWRHVRFPNTPNCRLSTPSPYDIAEAHLLWIDHDSAIGKKSPN